MHLTPGSGLSLTALPPAANVVDGDTVLLGHFIKTQIIALPHYHLLLLCRQHVILTVALLCL
jgi:hypothetical protein